MNEWIQAIAYLGSRIAAACLVATILALFPMGAISHAITLLCQPVEMRQSVFCTVAWGLHGWYIRMLQVQ